MVSGWSPEIPVSWWSLGDLLGDGRPGRGRSGRGAGPDCLGHPAALSPHPCLWIYARVIRLNR